MGARRPRLLLCRDVICHRAPRARHIIIMLCARNNVFDGVALIIIALFLPSILSFRTFFTYYYYYYMNLLIQLSNDGFFN
jgi:hypothetical protein